MVQDFRLFWYKLQRALGTLPRRRGAKTKGRRQCGGEAVWSHIKSHHWLLWTRAIQRSALIVGGVNLDIPCPFCLWGLKEASAWQENQWQACGQFWAGWFSEAAVGSWGGGDGDLEGGICSADRGNPGCGAEEGEGLTVSKAFHSLLWSQWGAFEERIPHPGTGEDLEGYRDLEPVKIQLLFGSPLSGKCELSVFD